ncbi:MAG: 4-alpha-glucanotransferase [Opitutales bacterium]
MTTPLFHWLQNRSAGLLLHPSSLPSDSGIGNFGREARRLIDFMQAAQLRVWQVCPLGPTGYGDSPYQCFSAFAGNPYFIDPQPLVTAGLVDAHALAPLQRLDRNRVNYGALYETFWPVLSRAFERFAGDPHDLDGYGSYDDFKRRHAEWLEPHALFQACKQHYGGQPWFEWPKAHRSFSSALKTDLPQKLAHGCEAQRFFQYLFFGQYGLLRTYAHQRQIQIMGDIPIFVALDSADVWANPEIFQLQNSGKPSRVAGVPPDYFAPEGQLWGNPLFDWKALAKDHYGWWLKRLQHSFALYDIVRIDHFRGFESYWSVPAADTDARNGEWVEGPGLDFFKTVAHAMPEARLVAEDLGVLTEAVLKLRADTGLPGMGVLQFAFGGDNDNFYLPHNLDLNCVVYPGTHDNNTSRGWYDNAPETQRDHFRRYLRVSGEHAGWDLIRAAYASVPKMAVFALQDLMSLGGEARLNTPGQAAGNWQWRYHPCQLDQTWRESAGYLAELAALYRRDASA